MTQNANIKTLKDGSIDYAHYIARSHKIRSNDAHHALAAIWRILQRAAKAMNHGVSQNSGTTNLQAADHSFDHSARKPSVFQTEAHNDNAAAASRDSVETTNLMNKRSS